MAITDTHSHIYLPEFDDDRAAILERAEREGVTRIIQPAIDSSTHAKMLEVEKQNPGRCFSMMGLHPCSIKPNFKDELRIAREYLEKRPFVAIGEIGLDFYWDLTNKEQQYEALDIQVQWALDYDLPVVIHSRNAIDECINSIGKHQHGKLKGVFHCFSGNIEQAKKIIELGFYLGIGGVVTFKNSGLDVVMKDVDLNHVVLETDAPYLAPVPYRGKRNEPSYIKHVVQKLAELKNQPVSEISRITQANADNLFKQLLAK
jgi:TatD DNase family protein